MYSSAKFKVLFLGVGILPGLLAAEQDVVETESLDESVVWGTRLSTSTFERDEQFIEVRQADHISDLLRTIPGVDVGGAHSLNQRVLIRSMDDKDLRITIDGASQNTYMYHHMGNLQIHADILKAVDLQVGTNSVVDGGLGGAVHFYTKDGRDLLAPTDTKGARLFTSVSSNDQLNYALSLYGRWSENTDYLIYGNRVERGNYEVGGSKILDENGQEAEGTDGRVEGLAGDLNDVLLKFGWSVAPEHRLSFGVERYQDKGDYSYRPDMGLTTDLVIADSLEAPLTYPTEFNRETATLNYEGELAQSTSVRGSIYRSVSTFWRDERGLASWRPDLATINEGEAINRGARLIFDTQLGDGVAHHLTYGAETNHYDTRYIVDGVHEAGEYAQLFAMYLQDRIEINDQWAVIPGVRYDNVNVQSHTTDRLYDGTTAALALEYRPNEFWVLKLSGTELFKAPEIAEVFSGAGADDTANQEIKAETGLNAEFSLAYQNDWFSAGATIFDTTIKNYIYDYLPAKDNIGDMRLNGGEAYFGLSYDRLSVLLTFSDADSELAAHAEYFEEYDGARIDRKQGFTTSLNVNYELPAHGLTAQFESLVVDDLSAGLDLDGTSLDNANAKQGYLVHNVALRWMNPHGIDGLEVTAGIDNIMDEYYASQSSRTGLSGHPRFGELYLTDVEPGRNVKLGVGYRF